MTETGTPFTEGGETKRSRAWLIILVIVLAIAGQGAAARRLPPPPPIQQPMVPAGIRGAAELACPNCGAAPTNVDRFGIATCAYCGTRYLVR